MSTLPKRSLLTAEEYLAIERKAEFKSEYFQGKILAMPRVQKPHNLIAINLIRVLGNQLLERDCNVYSSNMRVEIKKIGKYTYPDVAVTCGKELFEEDYVDTLLNPIVIFEILPDSTAAYGRGTKFQHYQFIESLVEYILIAQNTVRVEQYVRQSDRTWMYSRYENLEDIVRLESINCELSLKDIYVKVPNLSAPEP